MSKPPEPNWHQAHTPEWYEGFRQGVSFEQWHAWLELDGNETDDDIAHLNDLDAHPEADE